MRLISGSLRSLRPLDWREAAPMIRAWAVCYDARFMQTGIVGLPQSGKTTLFRILTRAHLEEKAARGATHIGVARVPEPRIDQLAALYKPRKVTYATVEYVDVGGIVRDRARDSATLAPLREVDALAHVLRVF